MPVSRSIGSFVFAVTLVVLAGEPFSSHADPALPAWCEAPKAAWVKQEAATFKAADPGLGVPCSGELATGGKPKCAFVYTLEGIGGGNDYEFFIAVLENGNAKPVLGTPLLVGGKGSREIVACKLTPGAVSLDIKTYGPDDPICCPSVPGEAHIDLVDGILVRRKQ